MVSRRSESSQLVTPTLCPLDPLHPAWKGGAIENVGPFEGGWRTESGKDFIKCDSESKLKLGERRNILVMMSRMGSEDMEECRVAFKTVGKGCS